MRLLHPRTRSWRFSHDGFQSLSGGKDSATYIYVYKYIDRLVSKRHSWIFKVILLFFLYQEQNSINFGMMVVWASANIEISTRYNFNHKLYTCKHLEIIKTESWKYWWNPWFTPKSIALLLFPKVIGSRMIQHNSYKILEVMSLQHYTAEMTWYKLEILARVR